MSDTVIGKSFFNSGFVTSTVTQLVNPASNTAGLHLRTCLVSTGANGVGQIYADTAAPSAADDHTKRMVFGMGGSASASQAMPFPLYLPAGNGLWLASNAGGSNAIISYDLVA